MSPRQVRNSSPYLYGTAARGLVITAARQYIPRMWSARLTLVVVAFTVAAFPAAIADLVLVSPANPHSSRGLGLAMIVIAALLAVPSMVAALLVRRRRSDDWLAPMLALTGFLPSLALLVAVFKEGPVAGYAVALSEGSWVLLFVSAALLVLFFPEGRVRGRDRWLAWAIAIDALLFIVVAAMHPGAYDHPYERSPHVFGTLPHAVSAAIVAVTLPGILVLLVLTSVSLVRRYRRAGADVRAQMKWLALAGMLLPLTLLAAWASYSRDPSRRRGRFRRAWARLCRDPDGDRHRCPAARPVRGRPAARLDRDTCNRDGRRARDLHGGDPRGRVALPRRFRARGRRGDGVVRAAARADCGRGCSGASTAGSTLRAGRRWRQSTS